MSFLSVEIGGVGVLVDSSRAPLGRSRRRYGSFETRSSPDYAVTLAPRRTLGRRWRPKVAGEDGRLRCACGQFDWELDLESGRGAGRWRNNAQNLDSVLRALYASLLPRHGGFLLHAAALAWDGRAHLFVGRSGAGKTTLARRLERARGVKRLSDELVAVAETPAGLRAFSTPFWGEFRMPVNNGAAPLGRIYFLRNAAPTGLRPLSAVEAQRRLLKCLVSFESSSEALVGPWDLILGAVARHPLFELSWDESSSPEALLRLLS